MIVKNKSELIERARWHAEQDHVVQGTYGRGAVNGKPDFIGCAIACLAVPHHEEDLEKWLRDRGAMTPDPEVQYSAMANHRNLPSLLVHDDHMTADIERQFGVTPTLMRCAEAIFENLPTHGEAIDFLPAFCEALPEGADLDDETVMTMWRRCGGESVNDKLAHLPDYSDEYVRQVRDEFLHVLSNWQVAVG